MAGSNQNDQAVLRARVEQSNQRDYQQEECVIRTVGASSWGGAVINLLAKGSRMMVMFYIVMGVGVTWV